MMDRILNIQQMLDKSRFVEAQKEAEFQLIDANPKLRPALLEMYLQSLKAQSKVLPLNLLVELVEVMQPIDPSKAQDWLSDLSLDDYKKFRKRLLIQKIHIAEKKGQYEELHKLISELQLYSYERRIPHIPKEVLEIKEKYFFDDFNLNLQSLSIKLLQADLNGAEDIAVSLILACVERTSIKRTKERITAIETVLGSIEYSSKLNIYRNFCQLISSGIEAKQDYKKLIEIVIYLEDFRTQSLALTIMNKFCSKELCTTYAQVMRTNSNYSFVYISKYFPHLKKFFVNISNFEPVKEQFSWNFLEAPAATMRLSPEKQEGMVDKTEEEEIISHLLNYQSFSFSELLDLAVGFLQSEFPWASLSALKMASKLESSDENILKINYLKISSYLLIRDFRTVLDLAIESVSLSKTENDLLSFMYCQAEAQIRLKDYKAAKHTLQKITSVNSNYRMAKDKLDMLNEV